MLPTFHQDSAQSTFLALGPLPTSYKSLTSAVYKVTLSRQERDWFKNSWAPCLAKGWKVGLAAALAKGGKPAERLNKFPWVKRPETPTSDPLVSPAASAQMMLEMGRLSTASRHLESNGGTVAPTPEVVQILQAQHPDGPHTPLWQFGWSCQWVCIQD